MNNQTKRTFPYSRSAGNRCKGTLAGDRLSPQTSFRIVLEHSRSLGAAIRPHDVRRTFARLAFYGGSGSEQDQTARFPIANKPITGLACMGCSAGCKEFGSIESATIPSSGSSVMRPRLTQNSTSRSLDAEIDFVAGSHPFLSGSARSLKNLRKGFWSGRVDSNHRPPGPEPGALPG